MVDFPMRCPGVQVDSGVAIRRSKLQTGHLLSRVAERFVAAALQTGHMVDFSKCYPGVQVGSGVAIRRSRLQTGHLLSRVAEPLMYMQGLRWSLAIGSLRAALAVPGVLCRSSVADRTSPVRIRRNLCATLPHM